MAIDDFLGKDFKDRTLGGKILYGTLATAGAGIPIAANEAAKVWKGDTESLNAIDEQIAAANNSPYNTAAQTAQATDYYDKLMLGYAKASKLAETGMTDAEMASAKQNFAEQTNLGVQNALNAGGGNLSKYINANVNKNANDFSVNLAAQNDEIKRRNQQTAMNYLNMIGGAADSSQNVYNLNFQKQILEDQALGQARKDWFERRDANRKQLVDVGLGVLGLGTKVAGV